MGESVCVAEEGDASCRAACSVHILSFFLLLFLFFFSLFFAEATAKYSKNFVLHVS